MKPVEIHTDGASRGNPGLAGAGANIKIPANSVKNNSENKRVQLMSFLGKKTNNQAEYLAILLALNWLNTHQSKLVRGVKIEVFLDSQLVVNQLNKNWKIKNPGLEEIANKCWKLLQQLNLETSIKYVPREKNQEADQLANQAIDLACNE